MNDDPHTDLDPNFMLRAENQLDALFEAARDAKLNKRDIHRLRVAVKGLVVLSVLAVVFAVLLGLFLVRVNNLATSNHQGAINTCEASPRVRAVHVPGLDYLLAAKIKSSKATLDSPQFKLIQQDAAKLPDTPEGDATRRMVQLIATANSSQAVLGGVTTLEKYISEHEQPTNCMTSYGR